MDRLLTSLILTALMLLIGACDRDPGAATPDAPPRAETEPVAMRPITFVGEPIATVAVRRAGAAFEDAWDHVGVAEGTVEVPEGHDVMLVVHTRTERAAFEALVAALEPDDIAAIYLNRTAANDAWLPSLTRLTGLRIVGLRSLPITDAGLAPLLELPRLERLTLGGTAITDAGLTTVGRLAALRDLDIAQTAVTDAGLVHLETLTALETLRLPNTITNAGLDAIARITSLRYLDLMDTTVSDAGLPKLAVLTGMRRLNLTRTAVTSDGIASLAPMQELQDLWLRDTAVDDAVIPHLLQLGSLNRCFVIGSEVSASRRKQFQQDHPNDGRLVW